jgi:diadenosine tetraphosphate (Ap4A) HIT family hydrolase
MPFDAEQYIRRSPEGPVFRRSVLAGHRDSPRHDVCENAGAMAFLASWPVLLGRCLAAPKRHVERWVDDLDKNEFVDLQRVVHRVARALAASVPTERMHWLSLGSYQGDAHLHWHVAALPPGVPYEQQQLVQSPPAAASWT